MRGEAVPYSYIPWYFIICFNFQQGMHTLSVQYVKNNVTWFEIEDFCSAFNGTALKRSDLYTDAVRNNIYTTSWINGTGEGNCTVAKDINTNLTLSSVSCNESYPVICKVEVFDSRSTDALPTTLSANDFPALKTEDVSTTLNNLTSTLKTDISTTLKTVDIRTTLKTDEMPTSYRTDKFFTTLSADNQSTTLETDYFPTAHSTTDEMTSVATKAFGSSSFFPLENETVASSILISEITTSTSENRTEMTTHGNTKQEKSSGVGVVLFGVVGGCSLVALLVLVAVCIRRHQVPKPIPAHGRQEPAQFHRIDSNHSTVSIDMQPFDDRLHIPIDSSAPRDSLFTDFGNFFRKSSTRSAKSSKSNGSLRMKKAKLKKKEELEKPSYLDRPSRLMAVMRNTFRRNSKQKARGNLSEDYPIADTETVDISIQDKNCVVQYHRDNTDASSSEIGKSDKQDNCDSGINCSSIEIVVTEHNN